MNAKSLIILFSAVFLGCSARGPVFEPPRIQSDAQGILYVYRQDTILMAGRTAVVTVDKSLSHRLKNNGYVAIPLTPGEHTISQIWSKWLMDESQMQDPIEARISIEGGKQYFVCLKIRSGFANGRSSIVWSMEPMPAEAGLDQIKKCQLEAPNG